jgi:hypothetical protein
MPTRPVLPATILLVALAAAACTSGGAPAASDPPVTGTPATPTTAPSPSFEGIAHPTGADEIILRFEDAGGFTPPEWQAARLPYFTLYGDGTVVFIQTSADVPITEDGIFRGQPLRTATLSEEQIQGLLTYALTDGGLAIARTDYQNPMVADAPTAIFTINADGDSKTVSAVALGMDSPPGPDTAVLKRLAGLGERLRDFDQGGALASAPYAAPAFRGVILEQQGIEGAQIQVRDWPWPALAPSDFALPEDPMALPQGSRTLTPDEAAAVGVEGYENGISSGVYIRDDAGTVYSLVLRPLLPDEQE